MRNTSRGNGLRLPSALAAGVVALAALLGAPREAAADPNPAPEFDEGSAATRQVAENSAAGTTVGVAVTASDENDTALTYSLSGAAEFAIGAASGQISVAQGAVLNFEATPAYTVTVSVSDGRDAAGKPDAAADASISVRIGVIDVNEPPAAPGAPSVSRPGSAADSSLAVAWSAPETAGKPALSDYDVRYRVQGSAGWSAAVHEGIATTTIIGNLIADTVYEVQVQASNAEGSSDWSTGGTGRTAEATSSEPAPEFDEGSTATRQVAENSGAGTAVGGAVGATDANDTALTYALSGGGGQFAIAAASGQISVARGAVLDHEANPSYTVTVSVSDGKDATGNPNAAVDATISVTIAVTDVAEPPPALAAPTVTRRASAPDTSLEVTWAAPDMTGKPAIGDYDVRYRVQGSAGWSAAVHEGIATTTTLGNLIADTVYEVQVQASNAEGSSAWSAGGTGRTAAAPSSEPAPEFDEGSTATRQVAENSGAGTAVGGAVSATDANDTALTYALSGGGGEFAIAAASGQISVARGAVLDHEATPSYTVTVSVSDGKDAAGNPYAAADATISVTIAVTDVAEPPPALAAPSVTRAASAPDTTLEVTWAAPDMTGKPAISDYDVRYRVKDSGWSDAAHAGAGTATTLTNLAPGTTYEVQVRAVNGDDPTPQWSLSGTETTAEMTVSNPAPEFDEGTSATRQVAENSAAGTAVGVAVSATDANDAALIYTLSGSAAFTIGAASGQIRVAQGAVLDFEATTTSYTVTVSVSDGKNAVGNPHAATDDTISVTIAVTDVAEPPPATAAPTVLSNNSDTVGLSVTPREPSMPAMAGKPPIDHYDIRLQVQGSTGWSSLSFDYRPGITVHIARLLVATTYDVQVRATNAEGSGPWSPSATATTNGTASPSTQSPTFRDGSSATRQVQENSVAGHHIGNAIVATDGDSTVLSYSLSGAAEFAISRDTGQIRVASGAVLDFEANPSYTVTVSVDDGTNTATISVTINVTDVNEPPAAPGAPSVTRPDSAPETSLKVAWSAPDTTGKPPISDYDVRYWVPGSGWSNAAHDGTGTMATLTDLTPGTAYEVQVRATNDEGSGPWSASGRGKTAVVVSYSEPAPAFDEGNSATREVAENSAAGTAVGVAVSATDANDTALTYSLSGGGGRFTIAAASGRIGVARDVVLDFEAATSSYTVTVSVSDGKDATGIPDAAADATISVTIDVTDVAEPPAAPAAPTLSQPTSDPKTSLAVAWSAPDTSGKPAISGYDVRYRVQGSAGWSSAVHSGTSTTTTLTGLIAGTGYEVQVLAYNAEGSSDWSAAGTGKTAALASNAEPAPAFDEGSSATREVAENSAAGTPVGVAVSATDANDTALTYSLSGGGGRFTIADASGRISVARDVVLDFEAKASYTVTVSVSDGKDATGGADPAPDATISVTIDVTDVAEAPAAPAAPTLSQPTSDPKTSLAVAWSAPDTTGKPAISGYDVRYRVQGSAGWSSAVHSGTVTTTTLTDLTAGTGYEVQVLAYNGEGSSPWSAAGSGTTTGTARNSGPNQPPAFDEGTAASRKVAENAAAGTPVGVAVSATDANNADRLTYSLSGAGEFTIAAGSGQISVARGAVLDYEAKASYTVTVSVSDGKNATSDADAAVDDSISVTIGVTDVDEPPPAPAAPRLSKPARDPETTLQVAWSAPEMSGRPALTGYEVRYRVHGDTGWSRAAHAGTGTSTTLTDLTAGTTYEVQVQAANVDGSSPWSDSARATVNDFEPEPAFDEGAAATRQVAENSGAGIAVGAAVTASDDNDEALTYSLSGGGGRFTIAAASGRISVAPGALLDYEATPSYTVTVGVRDGKDATGNPDDVADADIAITIELIDVDEPPPVLAVPTMTRPFSAPETSLEVTWSAPDMSGRPPVSGYDVEYRESDTSTWRPHPFTGTGLTTTLTGLQENTRYEVRVRARNDEGIGPWSGSTATPPTVRVSGPTETQLGPFSVHCTVMPEQVGDFDSADISVTNASVTDFEDLGRGTYAAQITPDGSGTVTVQVPAGRFHSVDGTPNQQSNLYQVEVEDAVPAVPANMSFALEENRAGPIVLGTVSDGSPAAPGWSWMIASGGDGKFAVEPASGRLSYVGAGEDYETGPTSYTLTVTTTSAGGRTAATVVAVHVVNVNEPPVPVGRMTPWVMHSGASITFNSEPYFVDPDGDALDYEADSSDPVVATARTSSPPVTITAQASGRTMVTVRTCDPAGACAEQQVGVLVVEEDIRFRPEELEVKEGAQETYTVNLLSEPPGVVTITLTSVDPKAATVSPVQLIFNPDTWNTPQLVTVTGVPDADHVDETVTVIHSASGPGYKGSAEFTVTVKDDEVAGVRLDPSAVGMDEGAQETYGVSLLSEPPGEVLVTLTSADPEAVTVAPERLIFYAGNWNRPQQVTVTGVPDYDHVDETVIVTHTASGEGYEGSAEFTVVVEDDEVAGVTLSKTEASMVEGAQETYGVSLLSEPRGEVLVTLTSADPEAVTVAPVQLIFNPGNWNTPQLVTVAGVPDYDHVDETVIVSHTASGEGYEGSAEMTVVVEDDEVAGVRLSRSEAGMVEGAQETYGVSLLSEPREEVLVTLTSADPEAVTVAPAQLTFDSDTWNTPQLVTVAGVPDYDHVDETVIVIHSASGPGYEGSAEFTVTVEDDEVAGVRLDPSAIGMDEGAQESYAVSLLSEPREEVLVTLTSTDRQAATVSPMQLIFDPDTWNTPQLVTVTGVPDADHVDETVTVVHTASGPGYKGSAEFTVTVVDDEVAGVRLSRSAASVAEGEQGTYGVSLLSEPPGEVVVTLASADPEAVAVAPERLIFYAGNWNRPQQVTVTGVADADAEDETVIVTHVARGEGYAGRAETIAVTVADDEVAGVRPSLAETSVAEGASASYAVSLLSEPRGAVTVTLTSADPEAATVAPEQVLFDRDNWNTPQPVTVTGVADADAADETVDITHSASGAGYEGSAAVTVTVVDDDEPGVTFIPVAGQRDRMLEQAAAGERATAPAVRIDDGMTVRGYGVVLDTLPDGEVTITPESEDPGTLGVASERLTFTADNWDQPQYVTLASAEVFEDTTVRVRHRVSGANYQDLAAAAVTVTVVDDEREQRSRLAEHWLARFGRSVAEHAVDTVRGRAAASSGESYVILNGQRLGAVGAAVAAAPEAAAASVAGSEPSLRQFVAASAFQAEGFRPGLALWGGGAFTDFAGRPADAPALNGEVLSAQVGADYRFSRQWQAGVAASYATGAGSVSDRAASAATDLTSWLVSGYPYLRFAPLDELAVWLALGLGYGEMELDAAPRPVRPELALYLGAVGIDSTLLALPQFELALHADAFAVRLETTDSAPALPPLSVDVQRVRLLLEGRAELGLTEVSRLEPSLELGARYDHGDAENGIGGEVGGELAYVNTALGLNVAARGRYLITHQDSAMQQWGASLALSLAPGRGEGLALSLAPAWGGHDAGQAAAAGAGGQLRGLQPERLDLAVGYGLKLGDRGLLTPFGELGLAPETTRMRAGLRLGGADSPAAAAPLEVYVGRDATTQGAADPRYHFGLSASIRA